jgi:hypothetical protein
VGNLVKLSEQLVDALSQFRSGNPTATVRREPVVVEAARH